MDRVVIVGAVRTPIGSYLGSLRDIPTYDLGVLVLNAVMNQSQTSPSRVDEVIMGQSYQSGE